MSTAVLAEYTLSEMILLAAHKLEEQQQSPFSAEDLIVASWRQFPKAFGLKGYGDQYPDSNRVLASIMGEKGLARRGWLAKMGQKVYSLSKEGHRVVQRIENGDDDSYEEDHEDEPRNMSREQGKLLIGLLESAAADKIGEKRAHELTFPDACRFWGINETLSPEALDARLGKVETVLDQGEQLAAEGGFEIAGRDISSKDMELMREVHEHLLERFSRHLTLLRSRSR